MDKEFLQDLSLDRLIDLLATNTLELLKAIEKKDTVAIAELKTKVETIQMLIHRWKHHGGHNF